MTAIAWAIFVFAVAYTAMHGDSSEPTINTRAVAIFFGIVMMLVCTFFELSN